MNNLDEMKNIMSQLSNIFEDTQEVDEGVFDDTMASIKNGARKVGTSTKAALGSKKAQGRTKRDALGKKMLDGWYHWVGLTGKEGSAEDLESFLVSKVGFSRPEADQLMSEVGNNILGNDRNPEDEENNDNEDRDETSNDSSENSSEEEGEQSEEPSSNNETPEENGETSTPEETPAAEPETSTPEPTTANDNQEARNRTANDNAEQSSNGGTANDNAEEAPRNGTANDNSSAPSEDIPEDTNVTKISDKIESLMNYNNHNGVNRNMNLRDIMKNCTDLLPYIGRQNKDNISPEQRLKSAEILLDGIDFVGSNDRTGVFDHYSINERRQKLTQLIQELKDQMSSTNESINEIINDGEEISRAELIKFFDAAAAFAYEHNLVGKKRKKDGYGVPTDGGYNNQGGGNSGNNSGGRNYVPQSDEERDEKRFNRRVDNVWDKAETLGLDTQDIQDAKRLANKNKFEDISKPEDKNALSAIGWAFLKSLK